GGSDRTGRGSGFQSGNRVQRHPARVDQGRRAGGQGRRQDRQHAGHPGAGGRSAGRRRRATILGVLTMQRRHFLQAAAALGLLAPLRLPRTVAAPATQPAPSVDSLAPLAGDLTLYLGRGEGGLYGDVISAIRKRCPDLNLEVRRAPAAALVNTLEAENRYGVGKADLFWSIDATSLGAVAA